jgi:hypothetical protein
VPLAHVAREFQNGESPEVIRSHHPTLSLEQVYGAITFYVSNKEEVENDIAERKREEDEYTRTHPTPPEIKEKFARMREQMVTRRSRRMVRFLADASLHEGIMSGRLRREPAMDFLSASEAKLEIVPDPDVLALAAREDRILVTSDLRTMPRHFDDCLEAYGYCPGVFLVKHGTPLREVIEDLVLIWAASDAEEWKNRIIEIPQS